MRQVKVYPETWPLRTPFVIARGARREVTVVVVEIVQNGVKGVGECTPYLRYGETEASVLAQIAAVKPQLEQGLSRQQLESLLPAGAARNAIDCALWDLACRLSGCSLWQATGVTPPQQIAMAQTVSIDEPDTMAHNAALLWQRGARLLKIKLDQHLVTERLRAVRAAAPEATLIVDANESWHADGLAERCQLLAEMNIAMLEQPLPVGDDSALAHFVHPLPICADESCHTRDNLPDLPGRYDMINIKLDKSGGLSEALMLADAARAQGLAVMLGCMLCTSRAIMAALSLAPGACFVDLDGPTWLAVDVEPALNFVCGGIDLRGLPA